MPHATVRSLRNEGVNSATRLTSYGVLPGQPGRTRQRSDNLHASLSTVVSSEFRRGEAHGTRLSMTHTCTNTTSHTPPERPDYTKSTASWDLNPPSGRESYRSAQPTARRERAGNACFLLPLGNTRGTRRYARCTYLQEHADLRKPSARDHISVLLSQIPWFEATKIYGTHPMRYGPLPEREGRRGRVFQEQDQTGGSRTEAGLVLRLSL